ncbi:hypothetical protein F7725_003928 [Dissostichus mawsoni]|uniref:Uncharacterized protein n=1 Tax=Dissostichus mawsoni TaxID=36200 RepID=A0A7J5YBP1_DISMA|nr:hypothetical protein F7725_003928 [Dissostichus mawsoni]
MTMQRCLLVSKEQNMDTTKGFSAKVRMSRSTKACWIWFLRIRFCLLIFFMAKRCRVSRHSRSLAGREMMMRSFLASSKLVQVLLQLEEVDGGDEAVVGFGQAVSGQLGYLMVDEAEDPVGQRKNVFRRELLDEVAQLPLHLRCGLEEEDEEDI